MFFKFSNIKNTNAVYNFIFSQNKKVESAKINDINEKFLLENGYTAATYERYIKNIELKGQLLKYYSGGIKLPEFIIDELFIKENQIKNLEYINLNEIYKNKIIDENEIKKTYEENKDFFKERFISFRFLELKPEILTKQK